MTSPAPLFAVATAAVAALALSACASTDAGAPSASTAAVHCQGLANADGLRVVNTGTATAAEGGFRVPMKVEDRVGRRVDATCVFASGQPRWASALPAGLTTR
jgi:hypothetical protein